MTTVNAARRGRPTRTARRGGYMVAIIVNVVLLWVAHNLLAWDLLPFVTADFADVLPLITLSVVTTIAANVAYVGYDPTWLRALGDALTTAVSLLATVRLLTVFPFDLSTGTLDAAVRGVLWLVVIGSGIAVVVNLVRGVTALIRAV